MGKHTKTKVFETELKRRFAKSFLDLIILQLVQTQPIWGYEIIKKIAAEYGVMPRHGALYPLLNALEKKGFVTRKKDLKKGRIRKIYKITPEGRKLLHSYHKFLKEQTLKENGNQGVTR